MSRVFLVFALLVLTGCAPHYRFDFAASSCLNPVNQKCRDEVVDSRPLEVRLYPVRRCMEPKSLKWAELLESEKDKALLGELWLGAPEAVVLERQSKLAVEKDFPKKTRCVLVVAVGRYEGERSVVFWESGLFRREVSLKLDHYDVFVDNTIGTSTEGVKP